jgi:hypothetical protein
MQVRERVSAEEAARFYGLPFNNRGWAKCCFHNDNHPSMSFKNGRFHCWVCDLSGDSIDFTARFFGLSKIEAIRKLNADFCLGLSLDRQPSEREKRAAARHKQLSDAHKIFEKWRESFTLKLIEAIREGNEAAKAPSVEAMTNRQAAFLKNQSYFEYILELLQFGSPEEQLDIFQNRGQLEQCLKKTSNA